MSISVTPETLAFFKDAIPGGLSTLAKGLVKVQDFDGLERFIEYGGVTPKSELNLRTEGLHFYYGRSPEERALFKLWVTAAGLHEAKAIEEVFTLIRRNNDSEKYKKMSALFFGVGTQGELMDLSKELLNPAITEGEFWLASTLFEYQLKHDSGKMPLCDGMPAIERVLRIINEYNNGDTLFFTDFLDIAEGADLQVQPFLDDYVLRRFEEAKANGEEAPEFSRNTALALMMLIGTNRLSSTSMQLLWDHATWTIDTESMMDPEARTNLMKVLAYLDDSVAGYDPGGLGVLQGFVSAGVDMSQSKQVVCPLAIAAFEGSIDFVKGVYELGYTEKNLESTIRAATKLARDAKDLWKQERALDNIAWLQSVNALKAINQDPTSHAKPRPL